MSAKDDLKEKLEMVLDFMTEKGLITENARDAMKKESAPGKEDSPLDQMVNELDQSGVESRDVYNLNFQNKLMGMFSSKALGMEPVVGAFMENLKNPDLRMEEDPKLDKLRVQAATISGTIATHVKNNQHLPGAPNPDFALLAKKMLDQYKMEMRPSVENRFPDKKDEKTKELDQLMSKSEDPIEQLLRNANGGEDTRFPEKMEFPILGPIIGNASAMTNQTVPDPNSVAYMVQSNTYNPGKPDDQGLENAVKVSATSQGGLLDAVSVMQDIGKDMLDSPLTPVDVRQKHRMTHLEP